ncbi:WD40 repeat-like protein [Glarea lozoyensis ATCC 20868]|uniref:WD40 repeat-like protein n=1 Tax=Glarea lozoyensis (strain ATCC 20868 / MF5171) TaxID=1116229 RepID=S3D413_GLAL2|nr:WD40 repeat-like protein [Glarea lozoyensis ATCC 20868]EPE26771.1 WD40 repeat-like protein [Glarea lozoyensis ATCC 20868]
MSEEYMDFDRFIHTFELKLDREFDHDDIAASWAPSTKNAPLLWGEELDVFELNDNDPMSTMAEKPSATLTVSPDSKFLAIATNAVIRIYVVESKLLMAELHGHEETIEAVHFWKLNHQNVQNAHYVVFSQDSEPVGADGTILTWYLDKDGERVDDTENPINFEGRFLSGSLTALSHDEILFVHSDRSITTQGWPRPTEWFPQLVVRSLLDPLTEVRRLKGHQDAIMWASWSSTDPNIIASASWDESCRIWNAATGECIHNIRHTSGQNWTGDFSPNGEQVVFAGRNRSGPPTIAIYSVATGNRVLQLEMPGLRGWSAPLAWSRNGDVIALVIKRAVILWEVAINKTTEVLEVHSDGSWRDSFCGITSVKWLDRNGEKLLVRVSDHTIFIWDRKRNWKWRLQRPPTLQEMVTLSTAEAFIEEKNLLLSLDGDWRVRTWELESG